MANRTDPSDLLRLQGDVDHIRNFCILAHVDHGKTTLSDSLVSSNGIISARLAGKLRFLDSTEEEQKRGITMHSSAISLLYSLEEKGESAAAASEEYLINLVDSPGHIDFSSDVSTAARLCDGALIIVDVLEGVCTQTHAVIYKALRERMRPCLILNKIDRLIVELRLTPMEVFHHLRRIIENVNALAFTLVNSEFMKLNTTATTAGSNHNDGDAHAGDVLVEDDHPLVQEWTFSPEKGNVQFASALDCWSFGLMKFINHWHKKLGLNKNVLKKYLFEDYCINLDTKKITKYEASNYNAQPMFVTLVLEPLFEIYENVLVNTSLPEAVRIAKEKWNIDLPPREVNPRDLRATLQSIMRRWLPLADSILRMVVRNMPNPRDAQKARVQTLFHHLPSSAAGAAAAAAGGTGEQLLAEHFQKVVSSVEECCNDPAAPLVVFVSKMMPVRVAELSKQDIVMLNQQRSVKYIDQQRAEGGAETVTVPEDVLLKPDQEVFMALGRVFSGKLQRQSDLFVMGNKYDPNVVIAAHRCDHETGDALTLHSKTVIHENDGMLRKVQCTTADHLGCYVLLGPSVFPAEEVGAGNIVGIVGLEDYVLKTATLSDSWASYPLKAITFQSKPMLKVAVEPSGHQDLKRLEHGLQQLYQFDPVVEIGVDDSGQHTMTCLGELHLDQCVKALIERFAKCEIKVSEPIVAFRETLVPFDEADGMASNALPPPWGDTPGLQFVKKGRVHVQLELSNVAVTAKSFAFPVDAVNILEQSFNVVQELEDFVAGVFHKNLHRQHVDDAMSLVDLFLASADTNADSKAVGEQMWTQFTEHLNVYEASITQALGCDANIGKAFSENVLSIGPKSCPANFLLFHSNVYIEVFTHTVSNAELNSHGEVHSVVPASSQSILKIYRNQNRAIFFKLWQRLHNAVLAGFHEATLAGPLMNEPVYGVGFVLEKIEISKAAIDQILSSAERDVLFAEVLPTLQDLKLGEEEHNKLASIHTGQLISSVKDGLRLSMLSCPVRIVEPIYQCDLQCDQSQLGNLYAVLSKRRGNVFKEDIIEGTTMFLLSAFLPVANSFHFAQELLKKTSGNGTAPQLSFSHWQLLEQDPFWRPRTEDELEEFGEQFLDEHNRAKLWINKIRKRKGLAVDEQVVNSAEKQRTLSRKK